MLNLCNGVVTHGMIIVLRARFKTCVEVGLIAKTIFGLNLLWIIGGQIEILAMDLVIYFEATEKVRSETCFGKECPETIETTEKDNELAVVIR